MKHTPNNTREELLRAALTCFSTHGFDGTSMRMIAEHAKRPLSLFPHYFGNKEGLYLEVFKWALERLFMGMSSRLLPGTRTVPQDHTEAVMLFREQIHYFYKESTFGPHSKDPILEESSRLLLLETNNPRPSLHPIFVEYFQPRIEIIRSCINILRPDLPEDKVVFIGASLLGLVVGHGIMRGMNRIIWNPPPVGSDQFQDSELLVDMCLHGLIGIGSLAK